MLARVSRLSLVLASEIVSYSFEQAEIELHG